MKFLILGNPIRWLILAHALAGGFALSIFALPLISKKGIKPHVKTGSLSNSLIALPPGVLAAHFSIHCLCLSLAKEKRQKYNV